MRVPLVTVREDRDCGGARGSFLGPGRHSCVTARVLSLFASLQVGNTGALGENEVGTMG